ncbi:MAG TPA: exosortase/archaeosortase family protein [Novosphingobium sp.]
MNRPSPADAWLMLAGLAWVVPAVLLLARTTWQTDAGSIGPLTLLLGLVVLTREIGDLPDGLSPGSAWLAGGLLAVAIVLYVVATVLSFAMLAVAAAWLGLVVVLYSLSGGAALMRCWFPLAYLLLVLPLPYTLTYAAAARLGAWLALGAVRLLRLLGVELAVRGSTVYVDQYELVVEQACAGLSSTVSLIAIGIIYARWVHRAQPVRLAVLALLSLPLAYIANQLRVAGLVYAVHRQGSSVLGTSLHPLSGLASFALALGLVMLVDRLLGRSRGLPT